MQIITIGYSGYHEIAAVVGFLGERDTEIGRAEQIEESAAMRKLLRMGYGLYLAEQYRAGRRTLREVADRLELSLSETLDTLQRLGITGNTGAHDTLASFRTLSKATGRR